MKKIDEIEASKLFNKNLKMPYDKLLINLSLNSKILNLGLVVLTSLSLGQYGKTSV